MNYLKNLFSKNIPEHNSKDERIVKVHAYIAGFLPDLIIGFEKDGNWYLPGGIVESFPRNFPESWQVHFYPLANYVKQQTGLILTGLSDAQQVTITYLPNGAEATILYFGGVSGKMTNGERLDINKLPDFAVECGNPNGTIEKLRQPILKTKSASPETTESLEGVFVSEKPTSTSPNGDKCYYLLRFYSDGLVLHTGVCTPSLQEGWRDIRTWFHRNSLKDMGRGQYHIENNTIGFTTIVHFKQMHNEIIMDFAGQFSKDRLELNLLSRTTGEQGRMSFIKFGDSA